MKWNKKLASIFAALVLVFSGAAVAIGLQVHATQTPPAQIQSQSSPVGEAAEQENGKETNNGIEANENLPGGGHQDQAGANIDHQFEGVE